jgi:hypothetical protein
VVLRELLLGVVEEVLPSRICSSLELEVRDLGRYSRERALL